MSVTINTNFGEIILPSSLDDVLYSQFVGFEAAIKEAEKSGKELSKMDVVYLSGFDDDIIKNLPQTSDKSVFEEPSITGIYEWLLTLYTEYKPTNSIMSKTEIAGDWYSLCPIFQNMIDGERNYTAGEFIIATEIENRFAKAFDELCEDENTTLIELASTRLKFGVTMAAVLLRKDGEELPIDTRARDLLIRKRMELFATFGSMRTILDCLFFLEVFRLGSRVKAITNHFLKESIVENE